MIDKLVNRIKYTDKLFYVGLSVLCIFWGVFYITYADSFDIKAHTVVAQYLMGNESGVTNPYPHILAYPLYHVIEKILVLLFRIPYIFSAAFIISICNMVSVILYRKLMITITDLRESNYYIDFVSIGAVIFMPAYSWLTNHTFYRYHGGANPLHNPTFLFVRPFAIICIIFFVSILKEYKKNRINVKYLIGFALSLVLSLFAKPSFAVVFLPAMGIVSLIKIIKNKDLKWGTGLFLATIPSLIVMIWQFLYMRNNSEAVETKLVWGGFTGYGTLDIIKVTIGIAPVIFILISIVNDEVYIFAWISFVIGWLQMFLLSNGPTGDYSWGFYLSIQVLTVVSLALSGLYLKENEHRRRVISKWRVCLGVVVYSYQIIIGIIYFRRVLIYGEYWI